MPPKRKAAAKGAGGSSAKKTKKADQGSRTLRWEWEGDGGKWTQYAKEHSQTMTDALDSKKKQINIDVAPKVTMVLQIAEGIQKNKKTGFERRIRIAIKDSKDDSYYVWQWKDENGKLNPYSPAVSLELEEAMESKTDEVSFEACHRSYTVDMATMKQLNTVTNVTRDVQRSKSTAEGVEGEEDEPAASSSAVVKQEEEEEEEEVPKKGKGKGSSGKSGRSKKGEENGSGDTKSVGQGECKEEVEDSLLLMNTDVDEKTKEDSTTFQGADSGGTMDRKLQLPFTCTCKFNQGSACSRLFTGTQLSDLRAKHLSLPKEDLDLIVLSQIEHFLHDDMTTRCSRQKHQLARKKVKMDYFHEGHKICRDTFMYIHGIYKRKLTHLIAHYRKHGAVVPRVYGYNKPPPAPSQCSAQLAY